MPTALDITTTLQDGVLKAVETSQRWTLGALRKTTEAMEGMIPETPKLPLVDRLPSPTQAVDTSFDFVERLLSVQRSFTKDVTSLVTKDTASPVVVAPKKPQTAV